MAYKDGANFTTYCDKPYDRHTYKVHVDGGDPIHVEEFDVARAVWFQLSPRCSTIEVVDK